MTLLIGCILIYHFGLEWGWYVAAAIAYFAEWDMHYRHRMKIEYRISQLEDRLTNQDPD